MKSIKYLILIIICFPSLSFATDLRGRVDVVHSYSNAPFPARRANVQLIVKKRVGSRVVSKVVSSYSTGGDGMYYFQKISPGIYTLVINKVLILPLKVVNTRLQDIPPILLKY